MSRPEIQTERERELVDILRDITGKVETRYPESLDYHEFEPARARISRFDKETRFMHGRKKVHPSREKISIIEGQDNKWWWTLSENPTAFNYNGIENHSKGFDTQGEAISAAVLAADEADSEGETCENSA